MSAADNRSYVARAAVGLVIALWVAAMLEAATTRTYVRACTQYGCSSDRLPPEANTWSRAAVAWIAAAMIVPTVLLVVGRVRR